MEQSEARICAVCGRVLEQWRIKGVLNYRHAAIDETLDHPPVAVRTSDAPGQAKPRCDFCMAEPVTHTLVVDKELGIEAAQIIWDTEWAMCASCSELVLTERWLDLRREAFATAEQQYGELTEATKVEMRLVYRDLRDSVVMVYQEPT